MLLKNYIYFYNLEVFKEFENLFLDNPKDNLFMPFNRKIHTFV